jgi:hypothetical protein
VLFRSIIKTLQVQGLAWDINVNTMRCTVTTMEPIVDGFVLDSTAYGILDTSVLTY